MYIDTHELVGFRYRLRDLSGCDLSYFQIEDCCANLVYLAVPSPALLRLLLWNLGLGEMAAQVTLCIAYLKVQVQTLRSNV